MNENPQASVPSRATPPSPSQVKDAPAMTAKIHRVCIGCNNMFEVTMDKYEVKHCPACRKE